MKIMLYQEQKFMKEGLTVGKSVYQTHKSSVYQTIQFTKHYSTYYIETESDKGLIE